MENINIQGVGLGLRGPHLEQILKTQPKVPWFELLVDNYFELKDNSNLPLLDQIRAHYPLVFHCVGMNLGTCDSLNIGYLKKLGFLIQRYRPAWVSDHLCWTAFGGRYHHDLLPLPYTEEAIKNISKNILRTQDILGHQILVENVTSYLKFQQSEMDEWQFLHEVAKRSDCFILLDINNIFVNAKNNGFNADNYLAGLPKERIRQFHLAGFEEMDQLLIDTHGAPVSDPVWELYQKALFHFGDIPTSIERDNNIPEFNELLKEMHEAQIWRQKLI